MLSQVQTLQGLVQHCPGSGLDPEGTEELRRLQTLEGHDWLSLLNPIVQCVVPSPIVMDWIVLPLPQSHAEAKYPCMGPVRLIKSKSGHRGMRP